MADNKDDEIANLTRLLYVASLFSKDSEVNSALHLVPALTTKVCAELVSKANAIHPIGNHSIFTHKLDGLNTCLQAAEQWRKFGQITNEVVRSILASNFMKSSEIVPDFFKITKRVGVFWDFHCLLLPNNYPESDKKMIYENVKEALETLGIVGEMSMVVIGDKNFIGSANINCFKSQFIEIVEAPLELHMQTKVTSDKQFLVEMMWWMHQNLFECNEGTIIVGITNDLDFKLTMQDLKENNHLMIMALF